MGGGKCLWEKNECGGSLCLAADWKRFSLPSIWAVAGQCTVAAESDCPWVEVLSPFYLVIAGQC